VTGTASKLKSLLTEIVKTLIVIATLFFFYLQTLDDYEWKCVFKDTFCGTRTNPYKVSTFRIGVTLLLTICSFFLTNICNTVSKNEEMYTSFKSKSMGNVQETDL